MALTSPLRGFLNSCSQVAPVGAEYCVLSYTKTQQFCVINFYIF
nr:MAG TPA: hypothetical protein [Caudoviricetes sp.]